MRLAVTLSVAVAIVVTLPAQPAAACAPTTYHDARAQGRVLGPDGKWRPVWLEVSGVWMRVEYAHPLAHWGRLAILGEIIDGRAWIFPVALNGAPVPRDARVTWKTTLRDALSEFHLRSRMVGAIEDQGPPNELEPVLEAVNGITCAYVTWRPNDTIDRSICLHESGMPVIVKNANGERIFELQNIRLGKISARRFRLPNYPITAKKPKYLGGFTCGGGSHEAEPPIER